MAEKKVIEIEVKDNSKTLKQQYKEAVLEVQKLADAYGEASVEFQEASRRAGELKDQIGDVNQRVKNLSSDTQKLDAALSAGSGIAGAFSIAEGAMATFGVESQDLQKSLLKVQGAMAVLNGVQAVANALNKDSALMVQLNSGSLSIASVAQKAYALAVGTSTGAMKAFRLALISIGIGAFVVLIGSAVSAMDLFSGSTETAEEKQKKLEAQLAKTNAEIERQKKASSDLSEIVNTIDREEIINAKKRGASEEELTKIRNRQSKERLKDLKKEYDEAAKFMLKTSKTYTDKKQIEEAEKLFNETFKKYNDLRLQIAETEADVIFEANKKRIENAKKEIKTNQDLAKTLEDLTEKNKQFGLSEKELLLFNKLKTDALIQEQFVKSTDKDKEKQRTDALLANEVDYGNKLNEIRKKEADNLDKLQTKSATDSISKLVQTRTTELEIEKDTADKKLEIEKALQQQKQDLQAKDLEMALQGVGIIKSIFEKSKGVQKAAVIAESAVGIAKMIIANKAANIGALQTPQAIATSGKAAVPVILRNNISTGLGIAANIVATGKALKALGGGSAPSGDIGGDGGGGGVIAPNLNVVGNTGINQLATLQQQPVKAYVVSNDITSAQQFDLKVQQTAQL